jgi:hypothetical protein
MYWVPLVLVAIPLLPSLLIHPMEVEQAEHGLLGALGIVLDQLERPAVSALPPQRVVCVVRECLAGDGWTFRE